MVRRFFPRDITYAKLIGYKKTPVFGPKGGGGLTRAFLKRFSLDNDYGKGPPCDQELMAVLDAMGDDSAGDNPHAEIKDSAQNLVVALRRCLELQERKGAKPSINYHLFKEVRPRS